VLYHCFIGKDRAGLLTALLLGACGVSDTDIMMDYSASMSCLRPKYNKMNIDFLPKKRAALITAGASSALSLRVWKRFSFT
jgi:protein tyrosine/serine phosphatase